MTGSEILRYAQNDIDSDFFSSLLDLLRCGYSHSSENLDEHSR